MKLSIVATLYNSAPHIAEFCQRTNSAVQEITDNYEIILVNDGSRDKSLEIALNEREKDKRIKILDLSRNFGHHKAMMAGLKRSKGEFVFLIDVDLEERPELINKFYAEIVNSDEFDVIYGIQKSRKGGLFERYSGVIFYKIISALSAFPYQANTLTARLMTKRYVQAVVSHKDKEFDLWSIFSLSGFNQKGLFVNKGHKGSSVYSLKKRLAMALTMIVSTSSKPLFYVGMSGVLMTIGAILYIVYAIVMRLIYGLDIEGWTSIVVSIWLVGGMNMFGIGVLGIYLSSLFSEVKDRPVTIVKNSYD